MPNFNLKLYLLEATGLGIFMISACGFTVLLEYPASLVHQQIPSGFVRLVLMGIAMGATAVGIFYSPIGKFSGAHINPAVSITFYRLGRLNKTDLVWYIVFQCLGGILGVYLMLLFLGNSLANPPVSYAVTVPANGNIQAAFFAEAIIAFIMMTMVLWTSSIPKLAPYTRIFSGCLVCMNVITTGPISGFGMNPARTLASAVPSGNFTAFWLYVFVPVGAMLLASEAFLRMKAIFKKKF